MITLTSFRYIYCMSGEHKKFHEWHSQKITLHDSKARAFFHEREVWFASLGLNIGYEQDGKSKKFLRPIVIIKKFNNDVCWGVPTTRKDKTGKYYYAFEYKKDEITTAILSQMRLIDVKRLEYKIGVVNETNFLEIKKRLSSFLG
jgi:mRNA interferase MazF